MARRNDSSGDEGLYAYLFRGGAIDADSPTYDYMRHFLDPEFLAQGHNDGADPQYSDEPPMHGSWPPDEYAQEHAPGAGERAYNSLSEWAKTSPRVGAVSSSSQANRILNDAVRRGIEEPGGIGAKLGAAFFGKRND